LRSFSAAGFKVRPVAEVPRPMPFPPVTEDSGRRAPSCSLPRRMAQRDRNQRRMRSLRSPTRRICRPGVQPGCVELPADTSARRCRSTSSSASCAAAGRADVEPVFRPRFRAAQAEGLAHYSHSAPRYSLFSPAPINALTTLPYIAIRPTEHSDQSLDWLGTRIVLRPHWPGESPGLRRWRRYGVFIGLD